MTNTNLINSLTNILRNYPNYNDNDLKVLFSNTETQKIAKSLFYCDVKELSADDFENVGSVAEFLYNCGLFTLSYGMEEGRQDFLYLSRDLWNRCRNYFEFGTEDYGDIISNEAAAINQLSEFESDKKNSLNKAIRLFNEAMESGIKNNSLSEGLTLMDIGICKKKLADLGDSPYVNLNDAINNFTKAKKIPAIMSSKENYYKVLGNEANSKRLLAGYGIYPLKYLDESKQIYLQIKNEFKEKSNQSRTLLNEGIVTRNLADYCCMDCKERILNDSIKLFQDAQSGFRPNTVNYASALTEEGVCNFELSKISANPIDYLKKAIKLHNKAINKVNFKNYSHTYFKILSNKTSAQLLLSKFENDNKNLNEALKNYSQLIKGFEEFNDIPALINLNKNMAIALFFNNRKEEAYRYLKKSIRMIEDMRVSIDIFDRKYFFDTIIETYKIMVSTCIDLNKDEEAFKFAESAKSRTFLELLYYKNKIEGDTEKLEIENIPIIGLDELFGIINKKTLIEYFLGDDLIIFILNNSKLIVEKVDISQNEIRSKVIEFRNKIIEINEETKNYNDGIINEKLYWDNRRVKCNDLEIKLSEFYDILIKPIEKHLNDEMIVVPHSFLHYLPFQALKNNRYLVQDYKISLAQSASSLEYLKDGGGVGSLVVGNPNKGTKDDIAHAEEEAKLIAKKLGTIPLIGDMATKKTVLNEMKDKKVLHFACHGFFNDYDPIHSGLKLSDEFITALDFMNMEINANLTVLSACDTALGEINNTDELEGLVRSIQYSGSKFVIASLWQIDDDSTKDLFLKFYNGTGDILDRIKTAEIDMIKKYDIYSWAPFQTYGI
jgi:CHAT domain-containing protein